MRWLLTLPSLISLLNLLAGWSSKGSLISGSLWCLLVVMNDDMLERVWLALSSTVLTALSVELKWLVVVELDVQMGLSSGGGCAWLI